MKNKKKPLVSVLMPNYNNEKFLPEAIESILNQTYSNFEFIIIDDCSKDNSWNIIQDYAKKDNRIKAYRNEKNLKIVKTRNKAFSLSSKKSKYYAIFDSDDISLPKRLELEINFLENNPDYGVVGSHNIIIDQYGGKIGVRIYPVLWKNIKKVITRYDPISQPVAMIRANVLRKEIGFYNERYTRCQDYELWFRIAEKHKIGNINEPLLLYRISTTQGKRTHLKETIKFTLEIQRKWLFHKRFFTVWNMIMVGVEHVLLVLPKRTILWIFEKIRYEKK